MKKVFLKLSIIVCAISLIIGLFQNPSAQASYHENLSNPKGINNLQAINILQESVQPHGAAVAIFFGGIVVAWIADGVITYKTGRPPSEWIALGLSSIEQKIKSWNRNDILSRPINVSRNGEVSGCVKYPCQIQFSLPTEPINSLDFAKPIAQ